MGIGISIVLLAVGAILAFALDVAVAGVDLDMVGWILMGVGTIGLLWSLFAMSASGSRRDVVVEDDRVDRVHRV